jgi:hypothetical protein
MLSQEFAKEVYTGKTHKFMVGADRRATFTDWLENELHECAMALPHRT